MLSQKTTHCPGGHELYCNDKGKRHAQIPASSIMDLTTVGWCDVCIEPFVGDERYTCDECLYDACWRCHESGRENYLVTMHFPPNAAENENGEEGGDEGQYVYGTLDVLKKRVKLEDADAGEEITCMGLLTLDFELNGLTWGRYADEQACLKTALVTFSRETGALLRFQLLYENGNTERDLKEYGTAIARIGFNCGFDDTPPTHFFLETNASAAGWIGFTLAGEEDLPVFGTVECRRFGLAEVPGFGYADDGNNSTLALLRSIAQNKRQVMDPMRNKPASTGLLSRLLPFARAAAKPFPVGMTKARKMANEREVEEIIAGLNLNKYKVMKQTGRVHHRDLIYCSRLSLLAYLTDRIPFSTFYPASREVYLVDPVWGNFLEQISVNEGKELLREWLDTEKSELRRQNLFDQAHSMFVGRFVAGFFDQDTSSAHHGKSLPLEQPLGDLGLDLLQAPSGKFASGGIEGFVAASKDIEQLGGDICIVFQGTNDVSDILVDFNGVTTPFEPMLDGASAGSCACLQGRVTRSATRDAQVDSKLRVHLGFYNAFLSVREPIERALRHYLARVPKHLHVRIVVTGHSLGGALANLCCAWLLQLFDSQAYPKLAIDGEITGKREDRLRVLTVSFGSPKVGITSFVDWMDKHPFLNRQSAEDGKVRFKVLRLVDVQDPITMLPPSSGIFDYMHTARSGATIDLKGDLIFMTADDCKKIDSTSKAIGILAKHGSQAMLYHDLFVYLDKCLHFAWKLAAENEGTNGEVVDWEDGPLQRAFGGDVFHYDEFTRSDEFLENF